MSCTQLIRLSAYGPSLLRRWLIRLRLDRTKDLSVGVYSFYKAIVLFFLLCIHEVEQCIVQFWSSDIYRTEVHESWDGISEFEQKIVLSFIKVYFISETFILFLRKLFLIMGRRGYPQH